MLLRRVRETDAEALLRLRTQLDAQSEFMMYEPGERRTTAEQQREEIGEVLRGDRRAILVAEEEGRLVGFVEALRGEFNRNRHVAQLVLGVHERFAGRGVGTSLLAEVERWAGDRGICRLELTVMTHNRAALALYRKAGFAIEGTRERSMLVWDSCIDEYYMAKLLG